MPLISYRRASIAPKSLAFAVNVIGWNGVVWTRLYANPKLVNEFIHLPVTSILNAFISRKQWEIFHVRIRRIHCNFLSPKDFLLWIKIYRLNEEEQKNKWKKYAICLLFFFSFAKIGHWMIFCLSSYLSLNQALKENKLMRTPRAIQTAYTHTHTDTHWKLFNKSWCVHNIRSQSQVYTKRQQK